MSKIINISLPEELVVKIDELAKGEYASRSDFIRETLVHRLRGRRIVDEWGDAGKWETIVDFSGFPSGGVPTEEVLKSLKRLRETDERNRKASKKA